MEQEYFDYYALNSEPEDNGLNWSINELEELEGDSLPQVHYFYSPYCFASNEIKNLTNYVKLKSGKRVNWASHDITTQVGLDEFNYYTGLLNFSPEERVVPLFVYGEKKLSSRFEINETSLENAIREMEGN
ncbi:hypothetical protein HZC08_02070 [Candidatus Micrarchaeota archaeon]|nr:hypothetical protein [Candidatus Micrarchaeota archaeon]